MRVLKLAILSFFFLFLVVTIISLFIPGNIRISKAKNIATTEEDVYKLISQPADWIAWHPALKALPEKDIVILKDGSIKARGTTIKLVESNQGQVISEIAVENGRPLTSAMKLINHPGRDSLTLQWYLEFRLRWYPWEKFRSLFYENIYGVQMEQGLTNLKEIIESNRPSKN